MNVDGSSLRKISSTGSGPVWSPDGSQIAYTLVKYDFTPSQIYLMKADGSGQVMPPPVS